MEPSALSPRQAGGGPPRAPKAQGEWRVGSAGKACRPGGGSPRQGRWALGVCPLLRRPRDCTAGSLDPGPAVGSRARSLQPWEGGLLFRASASSSVKGCCRSHEPPGAVLRIASHPSQRAPEEGSAEPCSGGKPGQREAREARKALEQGQVGPGAHPGPPPRLRAPCPHQRSAGHAQRPRGRPAAQRR